MSAPADPSNGDHSGGPKPSAGDDLQAVRRDDLERTLLDQDQTLSDSDQTSADSDQMSADSDQLAADEDQAASDHDLAGGSDPRVHEASREVRHRTTHRRELSAAARMTDADSRDSVAMARDLAAADRDAAAEARDTLMRELGAQESDPAIPRAAADVLLRAAEQRRRARKHRAIAAKHREEAARDRAAAAEDREQAARERARSLTDRRALMRELSEAATDAVTGARVRAAGLADLEVEINRTRRDGATLVVAFVDVVGLKVRNDQHGHAAGDKMLRTVVTTLRKHLRAYDLIARFGGDEFVCTMSGASLPETHERFRLIAEALRGGDDPLEITAGFAELEPGDTSTELIARADLDMIAHRRAIGSTRTEDQTGG